MNESSLIDRFRRKFQEQYLALQLEKKVSKEQILEDYLNTINLGAGTYGVRPPPAVTSEKAFPS